ncbi:MAG: transposase [Opitutus sp.]
MIGVLHPWGRQLQHHPHLHFIVAGGGLSPDQTTWRPSRSGQWFLPFDAVGAQFRLAFEAALRAAASELHAQVPDSVWCHGWWANSQSAGSGQEAVRYLAR